MVDGKETVCHIFEYTTQISVDAKPSLVVPSKGNEAANMVPVQVILAIKQRVSHVSHQLKIDN